MVRKLGRIKIDPGEFSFDGDPAPIEVLLPPGAVVFTIIASDSTPWLYFYYEGPNWRKKTAGFVMQRFFGFTGKPILVRLAPTSAVLF